MQSHISQRTQPRDTDTAANERNAQQKSTASNTDEEQMAFSEGTWRIKTTFLKVSRGNRPVATGLSGYNTGNVDATSKQSITVAVSAGTTLPLCSCRLDSLVPNSTTLSRATFPHDPSPRWESQCRLAAWPRHRSTPFGRQPTSFCMCFVCLIAHKEQIIRKDSNGSVAAKKSNGESVLITLPNSMAL